jgi:hypothetical protein
MKRDLHNLVSTPTKSLDVIARTASGDGVSADLKGFHSCLVIIDADAWTDGTHTLVVNESDDDVTFTAVAAADLIFDVAGAISSTGTVVIDGAADDDQAFIIGYSGGSQYVRVESTAAGTTTGAIYGAMIIPGHKAKDGKLNS